MDEVKKFPGQPVLSQILDVIPNSIIHAANRKHKSNRYYKKLPLRVHLVSLLYGVFSYCNGLRELCEGMLACEGKLTHLGLDKAPARSTISDANKNRSYQVFETIYNELLKKYHSFISDSRLKGLSIRNLKIIDSTTIRLFSEILSGVGRKHQQGGKRKGGIKEQYITVPLRKNGAVIERFKLRRITFRSDDGNVYVFITNNFTLPPTQIATIYKNRWMIELLFKQIKQNFPLRYFWGESSNAIKMQVYCVLIAQLLMVVIRKKASTKKSFSNMITVIRLHLMSYVELLYFIKDTYKAWRKANNITIGFSP